MQRLQNRRKSRFAPLRAEYDAAFETWRRAKNELANRTAAAADNETLRCFDAIVASAEREYLRKRNKLVAAIAEARHPAAASESDTESAFAALAV